MATIFGDVQYTQVMGHLTTPVVINLYKHTYIFMACRSYHRGTPDDVAFHLLSQMMWQANNDQATQRGTSVGKNPSGHRSKNACTIWVNYNELTTSEPWKS